MGVIWHRWGSVIWKLLQRDEEMAAWKPQVIWLAYEKGKRLMHGNVMKSDRWKGDGSGAGRCMKRALGHTEAAESSGEWKKDARLKWHFLLARNINVRCFLPLPSQPFLPSIPLTSISTSPCSIHSTSCRPSRSALLFLTSLRLPRVVPVVILLSETREGHGTHGDAGCSVTMVPPANRNGAKTGTCMCVGVCISVCGRGQERALLSASTRLGNGCLAGLPESSQPLLSQTTRFSWPSAAAQGHTPVSLIKTQPWHTRSMLTHHTHPAGLQLKITLKGTSTAIIPCTQHLFKIHSVFSHQAAPRQPQSAERFANNKQSIKCSSCLLEESSKELHLLLHSFGATIELLHCHLKIIGCRTIWQHL